MDPSPITVAIVVPVLNEGIHLKPLFAFLSKVRVRSLFVDGGSSDDTRQQCENLGFRVIQSPAGRAVQMNQGAGQIDADYFWFLHADCIPPDNAVQAIQQAVSEGYSWGRFNIRLTGPGFVYRVIANMMNWRSCWTQVATGDQGIFVARELFAEIGGYPEIPLMEDVAISKLLRQHSRGACIRSVLQVSSRRWEDRGVVRTILQMWWLRWRYFIGTDPVTLHREYYGE